MTRKTGSTVFGSSRTNASRVKCTAMLTRVVRPPETARWRKSSPLTIGWYASSRWAVLNHGTPMLGRAERVEAGRRPRLDRHATEIARTVVELRPWRRTVSA